MDELLSISSLCKTFFFKSGLLQLRKLLMNQSCQIFVHICISECGFNASSSAHSVSLTWWGKCCVAVPPSGRWPTPSCPRSSSLGCSRSWWWRLAACWAYSLDSAAPAEWTAARCVYVDTLARRKWKRLIPPAEMSTALKTNTNPETHLLVENYCSQPERTEQSAVKSNISLKTKNNNHCEIEFFHLWDLELHRMFGFRWHLALDSVPKHSH